VPLRGDIRVSSASVTHARRRSALALASVAVVVAGCNAILGLDSRSVTEDADAQAEPDGAAPPDRRDGGAGADAATPACGPCSSNRPSACDGGKVVGLGPPCAGQTPACSDGRCVAVADVASGPAAAHTCVLLADGSVRCWGESSEGRLGDGVARTGTSRAVEPKGLRGATALALGGRHTCALRAKELWCWGANDEGQVTGTPGPAVLVPTKVDVPIAVATAAAGENHTCAVSAGGVLICWGRNLEGQLGRGDSVPRVGFTTVNVSLVTAVCGGRYHGCASTPTKTLCWGDRSRLKLGNGPNADADRGPLRVSMYIAVGDDFDVDDTVELTCASDHTCARDSKGRAACWGENENGQLGTQTTGNTWTDKGYALRPPAFRDAGTIKVGESFTCIAGREGPEVRCAGRNDVGQLGDGTFDSRVQVMQATGVPGASRLGAAARHACALGDGGLRCWGDNTSGQLGAPTTEPRSAIAVTPIF
jgi:alpha-tubulin suppressor-like RCC1 family protein